MSSNSNIPHDSALGRLISGGPMEALVTSRAELIDLLGELNVALDEAQFREDARAARSSRSDNQLMQKYGQTTRRYQQ